MSILDQTQTTESVVEKLVGDGKKFADLEALAKGKLASDEHIANLERQLAEMKEDLLKQNHAKELLEELRKEKAAAGVPNSEVQTPATNLDTTQSGKDDDLDLKELVRKTLSETETEKLAERNVQIVKAKLSELYGTEVASTVKKKASELSVSIDFLDELAASSPDAFFKLIGEEKRASGLNPLKSSLRSDATITNNSGVRNHKYYQELRRSNDKEYYSARTQNQMLKDSMELGDEYFK